MNWDSEEDSWELAGKLSSATIAILLIALAIWGVVILVTTYDNVEVQSLMQQPEDG